MSHRSLRSTLVPLASGLAAVIAVTAVPGTTPALGATGVAAPSAVRAQEWRLADLHVPQARPSAAAPGTPAAAPGTGRGAVDAARTVDLTAVISPAGRARPAAADRAGASTLAGSLVRDVVAVLGVLILLLVVLLLVMTSRRRRAAADPARARSRGSHTHRRPDGVPGPARQAAPEAVKPSHAAGPGRAVNPSFTGGSSFTDGSSPAAGPGAAVSPGPAVRPQMVPPVVPAAPAAPAAGGWPAPGGWQGGSLGEIATSSPRSFGPAMTPVPKAASATRRARASGPGAPPWAPAPEPERTIGSVPLPMAPTRSFSPRNGPGLRVPGDMATRPAVADPDGPATIPDFAELPGFPAPAAPSQPAAPESAGRHPAGPGFRRRAGSG